ncbi:hypothetical protein M0804_004107 [Polistes exclamans]|nr:hypothetical protein M0804_004107 [Polistes exclamans]
MLAWRLIIWRTQCTFTQKRSAVLCRADPLDIYNWVPCRGLVQHRTSFLSPPRVYPPLQHHYEIHECGISIDVDWEGFNLEAEVGSNVWVDVGEQIGLRRKKAIEDGDDGGSRGGGRIRGGGSGGGSGGGCGGGRDYSSSGRDCVRVVYIT